ncbi:hypothetical protein [Paraburkholderia flagellata]|uniref:hypothetical protein n=1 Tax=Paraburkholderia flagellata TaxID=2883241 RepID=UPI001F4391DD|nr:hypothetical protein [Paraburkholderia flagellata]
MLLEVTANTVAITTAINQFKASYHADYSTVRAEAISYLAQDLSAASASRLVQALTKALNNWGAGKRRAPGCQPTDAVTGALCVHSLREQLVNLASSFEYLSLTDCTRNLKAGSPFKTVNDFDVCLLETLSELAARLLVRNTNVTYPMKALLLITGLMPAFDSQVRGGLHVAGLSGFACNGKPRTSYLIPAHSSADARRICVLPFYIAECTSRMSPGLVNSIENSMYPALVGQHGRLFDILLFQQRGLTPATALVRFSTKQASHPWFVV